ncbi:MAG: DUF4386 family protein [Eubacteriales bacterium]
MSLLVPLFFSMGALVLYAAMFRQRVVPRFISVWGFAAAVMVFFVGIAGFIHRASGRELRKSRSDYRSFSTSYSSTLWLIIKGFTSP